jgi:4-oxalocrotonate tautomerase
MPTTGDVVDQHLKCFGENDLDGVLADYSSDKEIVNKLTNTVVSVEGENKRAVTWVTIEEVCSVEWSIGGQARITEAAPALAASKNKTNILEEA